MSEKKPNDKSMIKLLSSMNRNTLGILICAAVLILTLIVYLATGTPRSSERGSNRKENQNTAQVGDSNTDDIKTSVQFGKHIESISDDKYEIEIISTGEGYTGAYVEDGTNDKVKNVLALSFKNTGSSDIQYAEYVFSYGKDEVSFKVTNLPAGQSCIALESGRHKYEKREKLSVSSRVVAKVDTLPFARDDVLVVDNSDDTITVMNLTEHEIPIARIFYKIYDDDKESFFGGITYSAQAEKIPAGSGVTIQPDHFKSGDCAIVGSSISS